MGILLSQVIMGRNDNYLGNFKHRLEMAANYTCSNVEKSGNLDSFELLICDFNSETPMREALNLNAPARKCTSFLEVTPEIYNRYVSPDYAPGYITGYNVAARRARGEFLMLQPADAMFPHASIVCLFAMLRGEMYFPADLSNCYLGIERYLIPWQAAEQLREEDLDRYFLLHTVNMCLGDRFHGAAGGEGASLLSRKLFLKLRGFAESYTHWGAHETDIARRAAMFEPQLKATLAGVYCYDLQQRPTLRQSMVHNVDTATLEIFRNDENWGLGKEDIPFRPAEHHPEIRNVPPPPAPYRRGEPASFVPPAEVEAVRRWRDKLARGTLSDAGGVLRVLIEKSQDRKDPERSIHLRLAFETLLHQWLTNRDDPSSGWFCSGWYGGSEKITEFFDYCLNHGIHELFAWTVPGACSMAATLLTVGRLNPLKFYYTPASKTFPAEGAAFAVPTLEITGYDHWQDCKTRPSVSMQMHNVRFKGYFHLQTGPMETALPPACGHAACQRPL